MENPKKFNPDDTKDFVRKDVRTKPDEIEASKIKEKSNKKDKKSKDKGAQNVNNVIYPPDSELDDNGKKKIDKEGDING